MIDVTDVKIIEVGPRDGLQNESQFIPTDKKVEFIHQLANTGLSTIEVTSFVSPKKIPQLKDAHELFTKIQRDQTVHYPVLVPNMKGFETALSVGANTISIFTSASETFNQKNINCSVEESLERFKPIFENAAKHDIEVRAYLSCCLGCPYEGTIDYQKTTDLAAELLNLGAYEISIGDTLGVGTPKQVEELLLILSKAIPNHQIAMHFHNTYGQAIANIYKSLEMGISTFDSSVAGLGGCPYANGATGNVSTEDVVYLMHGLGINTGIDLNALCNIGQSFCDQFNLTNQSRVGVALTRRNKCQD